MKRLTEFFEKHDFNVHLFEQDGMQCAEVEKWTNGGVDMVFCLTPFTAEEFINRVKAFDIDDEITIHRQDMRYRNAFSLRASLEDFEIFKKGLDEVVEQLIEAGI